MKTYLVGGAVRDKLLNLPVKDKDWVVVGGSPEILIDLGFTQVGKGFPVFLHPKTKHEHALARTETKVGSGHGGFEFDASKEVTLEQDLLRRDLTINAIAETESGDLIDPYGGQADLQSRVLRHVSLAFQEDPLRVLRVAKFAARFAHLGFTVANETLELMRKIAASNDLATLVKERVWQEIQQAMTTPSPAEFIRILRRAEALNCVLPEVNDLYGVPQPAKYHPEIDTGVHIELSLEQCAKLTNDPVVRYATLVHDVGKGVTDKEKWPSHYAHESLGVALQADITERLHVPKEYAQLAAIVCEHHTKLHRIKELRGSTLLKLLESLDAFRRPERLDKFLLACEADARGRTGLEDQAYPQREYLLAVLKSATPLDIPALLAADSLNQPKEVVSTARLNAINEYIANLHDHE
jgi:tRNA nucleotidyltransferase (CCA-adding enzyme)